MKSNLAIINVYNKKNTKSKLVTQLLYGESFKIIKKSGKWIKIKNHSDGYKGFIIKKNFPTKKKILIKFTIYLQRYTPNRASKLKKNLALDLELQSLKKKIISTNLIMFGLKKKI